MFEKTMIQYFRRDWKNRFLNSKVRHFDQLLKKSFSINAYFHLDIPAGKQSGPGVRSRPIQASMEWDGTYPQNYWDPFFGPKLDENNWYLKGLSTSVLKLFDGPIFRTGKLLVVKIYRFWIDPKPLVLWNQEPWRTESGHW